MKTSISQLIKELGLKPHQLHQWEARGWLGSEPVEKDAANNNQRLYTKEQVARIKTIQEIIEAQRKRGIKRSDLTEVERTLANQFGNTYPPSAPVQRVQQKEEQKDEQESHALQEENEQLKKENKKLKKKLKKQKQKQKNKK